MLRKITSKKKIASILATEMEDRLFPELFHIGFARHPRQLANFGWEQEIRAYSYDFIKMDGINKIILLLIVIFPDRLGVTFDTRFLTVSEEIRDVKEIAEKYDIRGANYSKYFNELLRFNPIALWEIWKPGYVLRAKDNREEYIKIEIENLVNRMIVDLKKFKKFIEWPSSGYVELSLKDGVVQANKIK